MSENQRGRPCFERQDRRPKFQVDRDQKNQSVSDKKRNVKIIDGVGCHYPSAPKINQQISDL